MPLIIWTGFILAMLSMFLAFTTEPILTLEFLLVSLTLLIPCYLSGLVWWLYSRGKRKKFTETLIWIYFLSWGFIVLGGLLFIRYPLFVNTEFEVLMLPFFILSVPVIVGIFLSATLKKEVSINLKQIFQTVAGFLVGIVFSLLPLRLVSVTIFRALTFNEIHILSAVFVFVVGLIVFYFLRPRYGFLAWGYLGGLFFIQILIGVLNIILDNFWHD